MKESLYQASTSVCKFFFSMFHMALSSDQAHLGNWYKTGVCFCWRLICFSWGGFDSVLSS